MPGIEVVPSSTTSTGAPGYAYVADNGYDPSKAPLIPGSRKRARNFPTNHPSSSSLASSSSALTARQQSKITKRLADLDKENHKDVQIVVPGKPRDVGARSISKGGKMTAGVKKILLSQKTWANYLADEEAAVASGSLLVTHVGAMEAPSTPTVASQSQDIRAKQAKTTTSTPLLKGRHAATLKPQILDIDTTMTDAPPASDSTEVPQQPPRSTSLPPETDSFLKSPLPALPSEAEIAALLSAPPLTYNASRAAPTLSTAPPRQFCEMCGYWGRARCMKCGVRVCGLECKTQHEETRCLKFYA